MGIINEDFQPTNILVGVPACSYWPSTIMAFLGTPKKCRQQQQQQQQGNDWSFCRIKTWNLWRSCSDAMTTSLQLGSYIYIYTGEIRQQTLTLSFVQIRKGSVDNSTNYNSNLSVYQIVFCKCLRMLTFTYIVISTGSQASEVRNQAAQIEVSTPKQRVNGTTRIIWRRTTNLLT